MRALLISRAFLRCACVAALAAPAAVLAEEAPADPAKAEPAPAAPEATPPAPAEPPPADKPAAVPAADPGKPAVDDKVPDVGATGMEAYGVHDEAVPLGGRMDWARRREIVVLQKRAILKEGRHGFSLAAGVVPNDDFFTYITGGLSYLYYFSEDLALKVHGAYTYDQRTTLEPGLSRERPEGPGLEVRLPQTLQAYALAGVDWNLVHGKFGFFDTRLTEFDVALNFGIGGVRTQTQTLEQCGADCATGSTTAKLDPAGSVGAGFQFYLSDKWAVRLDYTQLFYQKFKGVDKKGNLTTGGLSHPISLSMALTYFTAAPQ